MPSAKLSPSKKSFGCCRIFFSHRSDRNFRLHRQTSADLTPATQVSDELLSSVGWSIIEFEIRRRIGADRVISLIFLGQPGRHIGGQACVVLIRVAGIAKHVDRLAAGLPSRSSRIVSEKPASAWIVSGGWRPQRDSNPRSLP